MKKNIAVILSGCGVYDGAEITEAVSTLIALSKAGANYQCFSLDQNKTHIIDHTKGEVADDSRNILVESARIARGNVKEISTLSAKDYDGIIFPGGFGVAKNFCDFATAGENMVVDENIKNFLVSFKQTNRPIGALCIAPVLLARIFGELNPEVTVGDNGDIEKVLASWGANPQKCSVDDCVIDRHNKFVSSPAYMLGQSIIDISAGVEKLVKETLAMA